MPAASATVGTAASLYSGIKSSKDAKKSLAFAKEQYRNNQKIAKKLEARWNRLVEPTLEELMAESKSQDMSLAGRLAVEDLERGLGKARTQVENDLDAAGEGLTEGRLLTLDIDRARGVAGIRLDDEQAKRERLSGLMSFAAQTPGWASIATGANTQMGDFSAGLALQQRGAAASAYGVAAQGLSQLGQMWSERNVAPSTTSTYVPTGTYTPTQLRAQGLM